MSTILRLIIVRILQLSLELLLDKLVHNLRRLWIRMKTKG